jgi:hypothetical protein
LKQSTNHLLHLGFDSEMLVSQIIMFNLQSNQKHFEIPDILTSFFFLSKSWIQSSSSTQNPTSRFSRGKKN